MKNKAKILKLNRFGEMPRFCFALLDPAEPGSRVNRRKAEGRLLQGWRERPGMGGARGKWTVPRNER